MLTRLPLGARTVIGKTALVLGCCAGLTTPAAAHDPGLSSLDLSLTPSSVHARLSLSPRDAELAAGFDGDGTLTAAERAVAAPKLEAFARQAISMRAGERQLTATMAGVGVDGDSTIWVDLRFTLPGLETRATLTSDVATRLANGHRQLLTVRTADGRVQSERVLAARDRNERIALNVASDAVARARDFLVLGWEHILAGYDHLLFLAGLLLGVYRLRDVVGTASAFTIGHSVTLACAVFGFATVPSAVVEPLIAASIVYVALENLMASRSGSRWLTALPFGLIHGFGFAGALQELGIGEGSATLLPLGFFNLGVEAGQIAVALVLWPILQRARANASEMPGRLVPRVCSGLLAVCGAYWFAVRIG